MDSLVGKTIKGVIEPSYTHMGGKFNFIFDDWFCVFDIEQGYDSGDEEIVIVEKDAFKEDLMAIEEYYSKQENQ